MVYKIYSYKKVAFRICKSFLYNVSIFWSLECPFYTHMAVFSYDHDINIIYLYLCHLYIKNNMYNALII